MAARCSQRTYRPQLPFVTFSRRESRDLRGRILCEERAAHKPYPNALWTNPLRRVLIYLCIEGILTLHTSEIHRFSK